MMAKIAVWTVTLFNVFFVAMISPLKDALFIAVRPDSLTAEIFLIVLGIIALTPEIGYFIVPKYRSFVNRSFDSLEDGIKLFGTLIAIQVLVITSLFNIEVPEMQLYAVIALALGSNFVSFSSIINKFKK